MRSMTPEEHIEIIIADFAKQAKEKYFKGQAEHGGKLYRKHCLPFAFEETLDFYIYMHVVNQQLNNATDLLMQALSLADWELVGKALNLLTFGNQDGVPEEEK